MTVQPKPLNSKSSDLNMLGLGQWLLLIAVWLPPPPLQLQHAVRLAAFGTGLACRHPQRRTAAAQVSPAPKPARATVSPALMRPARTASSSAMGIDPAEVFP